MSISPDSVDLGYILKQIRQSDFTMDDFSGRLRLQKIIYILQAFGVYLGYDFQWYLRGPYCTKLAKRGFELREFYPEIPASNNVKFAEDDIQGKFDDGRKFITKLDDLDLGLNITDKLEIAASIHLLTHESKITHDAIIDKVTAKQGRFSRTVCEQIWQLMSNSKLVELEVTS